MTQKTHELKIAPNFLKDILFNGKTFEIRFNDRNFKVGDELLLKEFSNGQYGPLSVLCPIRYILENYTGLEKGYVILGLGQSTDDEDIQKLLDAGITNNEKEGV